MVELEAGSVANAYNSSTHGAEVRNVSSELIFLHNDEFEACLGHTVR